MATTPNTPVAPNTPPVAPVIIDAPQAPENEVIVISSVPQNANGGIVYPSGNDTAPCHWRITVIHEDEDDTFVEAISNLSNLTFRGTTKEFSNYLKGM
jgi:hypothetical protein